jgi:hypothetical protein
MISICETGNGQKGGRMFLAQRTRMNGVVAAGQVQRDLLGLFPWLDEPRAWRA